MVRLATDPETKAYAARRRAEGKTSREIIRCLKRYIAREVYGLITNPPTVADISDLRPARTAAGITLATVAAHFDVWPINISRLERGLTRNDELADHYRQWLALNAA